MTQSSFISSEFSGRDASEENVSRKISALIEKYFLTEHFQANLGNGEAAIDAFRSITNSMHFFRNGAEYQNKLLHEMMDAVCKFSIREKVVVYLDSTDEGIRSLTISLLDLIATLFTVYRLHDKMIFFEKWLVCLNCSIEHIECRLPTAELVDDVESIISDDVETTRFFLEILYRLLEKILICDRALLELLWKCYMQDNVSIRVAAIRCMSVLFPQTDSCAFMMLQVLNSMIMMLGELVGMPEVDDLLQETGKHILDSVSPDSQLLIARQLVTQLCDLKDYAFLSVVNVLLDFVIILLKRETKFCQFSASIFIKLFMDFIPCEKFMEACKIIADVEPRFRRDLKKKYENLRVTEATVSIVPQLLQILPDYVPPFQNMEIYSPDVLYQVCSLLKSLPDRVVNYLNESITVSAPSPKYLAPLMRLIPRSIIGLLLSGVYPPDVIADVIYNAPGTVSLNIYENELLRIARGSNSAQLAARVIRRSQRKDDPNLLRELRSFASRNESWKDKTFCKVAKELIPDIVSEMVDEKMVENLYKSKCYDALVELSSVCSIIQLTLKVLFRILRCGSDSDTGLVYHFLKILPERNEIIDTYRYYIGNEMFNLSRKRPVVSDAGEVLTAFGKRIQRASLIYSLFARESDPRKLNPLPSLVVMCDKNLILEYTEMITMSVNCQSNNQDAIFGEMLPMNCQGKSQDEIVREIIEGSLTDIFTYLFGYEEKPVIRNVLFFIQSICHEKPFVLVRAAQGLVPNLLLLLAHPNPKVRACTRANIVIIQTAFDIRESKNVMSDREFVIRKFWLDNIVRVLYSFSKIINDEKSFNKLIVIRSLKKSLKYIKDDIHKHYPQILSLLDKAIKSPKLCKACLEFWYRFIEVVDHAPTIKHMFGYIITQSLAFHDQYPIFTKNLMVKLIIEKAAITRECYPKITQISLFTEKPDLREIAVELKSCMAIPWQTYVLNLTEELKTGMPGFHRMILEQLLTLLKHHREELHEIKVSDLESIMTILWEKAILETDQENVVFIARCMSYIIGYVEDVKLPEQHLIPYNQPDEIMQCLITNYLMKILINGPNITSHDDAAYAIQETLKLLGCRESPEMTAKEQKRGKANWNAFDADVRNIIEPFRKSIFTVENNARPKPVYEPVVRNHNHDDSEWLNQFMLRLCNVSSNFEPGGPLLMFYNCEIAMKHLSSLSMFILPYLVFWHIEAGNDTVLEAVRIEWRAVVALLDSENPRQQEFAQIVVRMFFSLFETLSKWNISVATEPVNTNWKAIGIETNLNLSIAAEKCGVYHRALMHLEFHIRELRKEYEQMDYNERIERERLITCEYYPNLFRLYQKMEDLDIVSYLKEHIAEEQNYDETHSTDEIMSSAHQSLSAIEETMKSGRYERALADALALVVNEKRDQNLNRLIMDSALRLGRWEEIKKIYDDPQSLDFEISVAKTLYGIHEKIGFVPTTEIRNARYALIPEFNESTKLSYSRMTGILARYRILEEIDEFSEKSRTNPADWGSWHTRASLTIDQLEEVTAIRFAMINNSKEIQGKKKFLSCDQFLQLAKLCRKNNAFFKAEMFCTRARKYAQDDNDMTAHCIYETAKVYNERKREGTALSLITTAEGMMVNRNKELLAKMIFSKGKWNENRQSLDSEAITKCYKQAAEDLRDPDDMGKAYLALASLTDQRIFSRMQYHEQMKADSATTIRRSSSMKFWASPNAASTITSFLKDQLSLALNNYFEAMVKSPKTAHEAIPRVLFLCFDTGKNFVETEAKGVFETLSKNQREQVQQTIRDSMRNAERVPAAVWLNCITQLISRVDQPKPIEDILFTLIRYSVINYPQASLWHLMSVKNSATSSKAEKFDAIWDNCKRDLKTIRRDELDNMRDKFSRVTVNLIGFCSMPVSNTRTKTMHADTLRPGIREDFKHSKLLLPRSSSLILSSESAEFKDPSMYNSVNYTIEKMNDEVRLFLSLQCPRQIGLVASNGTTYYYLCKEDEDLRKDMRMMEFASFVNLILSNDRRCRERGLRLVTYAVICLNEKCGIIEWVKHTTCLRAVVEKIYKERGIVIDRNDLKRLCGPDLRGDVQTRVSNFENIILKKYTPVMHLWFHQSFRDLLSWFQSRLLFTRSTAVWSIVGYIVGLGDRHAENILLNEVTGMAVHVDFNCIFDRAKAMEVPEKVPFRMTQNIVDGMGIMKTQGTFSKTCELVVETLRAKKQKLVSVLRPFIYDPLLEWKKGGNKTATETTAKLTLKEIDSRLEGFSEDRSTIYSPECTVSNLIEQATNTGNLAVMFHGWQAFI